MARLYSMSIPMLRAVPSMVRMAACRSRALRSGIFSLAISSTCALVNLGHLVPVRFAGTFRNLSGLLEQDRSRGGLRDERKGPIRKDRDDHRNDHSLLPLGLGIECLAELHDVHTMLPQGGTDGRRGIRLPGGTCNLMFATTFFAILSSNSLSYFQFNLRLLNSIHLNEIKLDRCRSSKNTDQDPHLSLLRDHFVDDSVEIGERTVHHPNLITLLELNLGRGFWAPSSICWMMASSFFIG